MHAFNNSLKLITYFPQLGFAKKVYWEFLLDNGCSHFPFLHLSISLSLALIPLSLPPLRMVLVFISSVLGACLLQTFWAVCFQVCLYVHEWQTVSSCVCQRNTFLHVETARGGKTSELKREASSVRSSILVPLTWLVVKQASPLIWHLFGEYTLSFYLSSLHLAFCFRSVFCCKNAWMCKEKRETYALSRQTCRLPSEHKCWL